MFEKGSIAAHRLSLGSGVLLLLTAAISLGRAASLIRSAPALTAPSERRFFEWAWRDPAVNAALAKVEPQLRYGETVCVQDMTSHLDPGWLRVMAIYELPQAIVLVPANAPQAAAAPACRRTVLHISPGGSLRLERAALVPRP